MPSLQFQFNLGKSMSAVQLAKIENGEVAGLKTGDTFTIPQQTKPFVNGEASAAIGYGQPVYISGVGTVKLAVGNNTTPNTADVFAVCADASIAIGATGNFFTQAGDVVTFGSTGAADSIGGTTGGLTAGVKYFLDPTTPGKITATPPITPNAGLIATLVYQAISTVDAVLIDAQSISI